MHERIYKDSARLRQYWLRGTLTYVLALIIIALLALLSHYLVQSIVDEQEATARVVNLAGRQRMLSQRITLYAGELREASSSELREPLTAEYFDAMSTMSTMHYALMNGSNVLNIPMPTSDKIQQIFSQPPVDLHKKVVNFLSLAESVTDETLTTELRNDAYQQLKVAAHSDILQSLDTLVFQFQADSESAIKQLQQFNRFSLGGLLLTLFLEAFFIFRPLLLSLHRREKEYLTLLQDMDDEIAEKIQFQTFNDPLTELPNRVALLEKIKTYIDIAQQNKNHVIVISIGLDRFKDVNDSLGHDLGDLLLLELAERLRDIATSHRGVVARVAGDEFAIVLEQVDEQLELVQFMRQLSQSIAVPFEQDNTTVQVTASLGLAFYADDGADARSLLMHANQAMRSAKDEGGNCFRFFQSVMTSKMTRRIKLEQELRQALNSSGQLMLFFQPKVALASGQVTGVEALLRWHHPEEGMLSPVEFIPIAEDSGLIQELGDWVIVQSLWQLREWQRQDIFVEMAINVSVKQLLRGNLSDRITSLVEQMEIEPRYVQLEVTESHIMDNMNRIMQQLQTLAKAGFSLAIDDFGTGHSSLARLRDLPFKVLKIDRSFVSNALKESKDQQLVAAIIDIGHSMNKSVIAEGIETIEQQLLLQSLGCDEGQGYLYSRPRPAKQLLGLLQQGKIELNVDVSANDRG
ncbi:EAL domain-containing protein [Shewanella sp. C32]|uniref:EAL domain-containing protein n=1 Tax=Shewanella electrica TaxID=515560 RepID=A0ABT2FLW1_9GAMM|nr:EAL domain-containing protein [Shewanella electrica]MCH1925791.1 EAL domain-containing protein [Shewanella electrica]MCS4557324.1 EAL domain-containing protein [Shewanella electrica]